MKLLFDQNLSPGLAGFFENTFAGSKHVIDFNLERSDDAIVWEFAKSEGFTIVTKDSDFNNLVAFFGFPPKVIWVRQGNCSTTEIRELLNSNAERIKAFISDSSNGILTFY